MNIIDQLPSNNDNEILWKFEDTQLYEKYTQYVKQNKKNIIPVTTPMPIPKKIEKDISTTGSDTELSKFFPIYQDDKQYNEKQDKQKKQEKPETQHSAKSESCKTETIKRVKRENPTIVILKLSENNEINSGYMQQKLIDFISKKEFIKFFGVKKSSEVMSALSANKWNKSLVLFISFLFDVSFIYLNKEVQYDSEKKYGVVITI